MLPDRVSNPGPPTYESGVLPIALRGPALLNHICPNNKSFVGSFSVRNMSLLLATIPINVFFNFSRVFFFMFFFLIILPI